MTEPTKIRARVSGIEFARVAHFRANGDIRYYLEGVLIERAPGGGVYLVACDGASMGVTHDPAGEIEGAGRVIVKATRPLLAAAVKPNQGNKAKDPRQVVLDGKRLTVAAGFDCDATTGEFYVHPGPGIIEDRFPDWRRVLPDFDNLKPGAGARFNGGMLARFALADRTPFTTISQVRLWQQDEHSAIAVQLVNVPQFIGILMPQRGGTPDDWNFMKRYADEKKGGQQ